MLDDAFFNVEQFITGELTTEFAAQEDAAFTSGDGSKKPKGLLAYGSDDKADKERDWGKLQHLLLKKPTELTADEVMKLIYTLRKPYRNGAKFMMNNNTLFKVRTLKDSEITCGSRACNWVSRLHYWDMVLRKMSSLLIWLPVLFRWRLVTSDAATPSGSYRHPYAARPVHQQAVCAFLYHEACRQHDGGQ